MHTCELPIALNEIAFQIPWLTKSTFGKLLGVEPDLREIDRLVRRLCKQHVIECRIMNAVIFERLTPLSRPELVTEEFLTQVKARSETQSCCVANPLVLIRASRLTAGLTGRGYARDLCFDELNATLRLGDAIRWNADNYGKISEWQIHKRGPENKLPAVVASFAVPKSLRRRYCVVPLPLSFRTAENLIRNLHRSGVDYEIW
jgi:hypothetical protein